MSQIQHQTSLCVKKIHSVPKPVIKYIQVKQEPV